MKKSILLCAAAVLLGISAASAAELVPNRLAEAAVGEWASFSLPSGYIQKHTVLSREGEGPEAEVTVSIEDIYEGEIVSTREMTMPAGEAMTEPQLPDAENITVRISKETASVKGSTLEATVIHVSKVYEDDEEDNEESEWWVSSSVPVFGLIKKVVDGETAFEIADFGE